VHPGGAEVDGGTGFLTVIGDADPLDDVCSTSSGEKVRLGGRNIGDMLNAAGVSWGFFSGGFDLTKRNPNGTTGCARSTTSLVTQVPETDYIPHHQPFQYYTSTANPMHQRPASLSEIGHSGPANHQYDTDDFFAAVQAGHFPAVSFLKAPGYQDGHAGYSDPLDEQTFVVHTMNFLQQQPDWDHTVVVIAYDDSDGWYDHQMSPIVNPSATAQDALSNPGQCGTGTTALPSDDGANPHAQGRCGYGPRLPLLVLSPWARPNFVDHTQTDQTSIIRFIEDRWLNGERVSPGSFDNLANSIESMLDLDRDGHPADRLFLSESTGEPIRVR
jgi:phospholipase C